MVPSFWGNSLEDLGQSGCDIVRGVSGENQVQCTICRSYGVMEPSVSYWVSRGQDINTGETPAPFCQRKKYLDRKGLMVFTGTENPST